MLLNWTLFQYHVNTCDCDTKLVCDSELQKHVINVTSEWDCHKRVFSILSEILRISPCLWRDYNHKDMSKSARAGSLPRLSWWLSINARCTPVVLPCRWFWGFCIAIVHGIISQLERILSSPSSKTKNQTTRMGGWSAPEMCMVDSCRYISQLHQLCFNGAGDYTSLFNRWLLSSTPPKLLQSSPSLPHQMYSSVHAVVNSLYRHQHYLNFWLSVTFKDSNHLFLKDGMQGYKWPRTTAAGFVKLAQSPTPTTYTVH